MAKRNRDATEKWMQDAYQAMDLEESLAFNRFRDVADTPVPDPGPDVEGGWEDMGGADLDDAIDGREGLVESGAGGEFMDTLEARLRAERERGNKTRTRDTRKRRERTAKVVQGFAPQMDAITDAYLEWSRATEGSLTSLAPPLPPEDEIEKFYEVCAIDLFAVYTARIPMRYTDKFTTATLVSQELFRVAHLRTPTLSIQAWSKTIAEVQHAPWRPYVAQQFSMAFDVYLDTLDKARARVMAALDRGSPTWCLQNCCAPCMYKLEGEEEMRFSMLVTCDGNDSLKRVLRKEPKDYDEEGNLLPGVSKERFDPRAAAAGKDYFVPRDKVNMWSKDKVDAWQKEVKARRKKMEREEREARARDGLPPKPAPSGPKEAAGCDTSACEERWKNLADDAGERMWAVYDETGLFICLCRHSFVLLAADMVVNCESVPPHTACGVLAWASVSRPRAAASHLIALAKYPLAIFNELLKTCDANVGAGYDIGCGHCTTLWKSPLGHKALLKNFLMLVGAFHGHAHNRLCQLWFLATYITGLGLEDLEGCERFFSGSNKMAGSVRHATAFHRLQTITSYFAHSDSHEAYANLSKFIVSNYWQALEILEGESALQAAMAAAGIDDVSEFPTRLADEMKFLKGLMKESDEDSLQMEYYQRLFMTFSNFHLTSCCPPSASAVLPICPVHAPPNRRSCPASTTRVSPPAHLRVTLDLAIKEGSTASKTVRRHAQENYDKALAEVQETELKMGVVDRWLPTSKAWADAAELVSTKRYHLALLKLERLVVQRMFELTKMNLSQTGYKLRKHIAKALQARSQAIRNALKTYNAATASIVPQGRKLSWDEVVEYAFLADFDLLRDPETFGQVKPWSTPAARILLDKYFKIERAREEIQRCNIEIRRLITHIRDEREFLIRKEAEVRETDPELAWGIRQYRWERGRYDGVHIKRFAKLAADAGPLFTGTLEPGVHRPRPGPPSPSTSNLHCGSSDGVDDPMQPARGTPRGPQEAAAMSFARTMEAGTMIEDTRDEIDDDIGEREEGERIAEELDIVYRISDD
ncbi:hypothetical protein C8R46DRAFT_1226584 [Mycena filopes]|nr:hypothetical protein C8R46DRAFT_1226584 [Mycena filopes]